MIHYVQCPRLFGAVSLLARGAAVPPCPIERLGIKNPTVEKLKIIACSFAIFSAN